MLENKLDIVGTLSLITSLHRNRETF